MGIGRNLMVSKLPATWEKLHHQPATAIRNNTPQAVQQAAIHKIAPIDYTQYLTYSQEMISYTLSHEGKDYKFYIPEKYLIVSMTNLITGLLPTVKNLPIWL